VARHLLRVWCRRGRWVARKVTTHLITMLYFVAGKLRLPQC